MLLKLLQRSIKQD